MRQLKITKQVTNRETASLDKKFDRFIKRKKYTSIFRVNDSGSTVQFYFLENKNTIKEMVLKIKSDDSYVLLGLKTNISNSDFESIIQKNNLYPSHLCCYQIVIKTNIFI